MNNRSLLFTIIQRVQKKSLQSNEKHTGHLKPLRSWVARTLRVAGTMRPGGWWVEPTTLVGPAVYHSCAFISNGGPSCKALPPAMGSNNNEPMAGGFLPTKLLWEKNLYNFCMWSWDALRPLLNITYGFSLLLKKITPIKWKTKLPKEGNDQVLVSHNFRG